MFRLVHSFSLAIIITLAWACASYAQSVPVTGDANIPGVGITAIRNTCDPDIEEVIRNQAWEAGQREITQNANLYPRPDSVLSLSCFDSWLNHQAWYAYYNEHFPGNPDESEGLLLNGLMTDLLIVLPDDIISRADPNLTTGYVQFGILEILVTDQLINANSITGQAADAPRLALCGGTKDYYIDTNFPDLMIGDRAKTHGAVPAYSSISSALNSSVDLFPYGTFINCNKMNEVWNRTKCYDFATEEDDFYKLAGAYTGTDHDGFYTYEDYVATANADEDYRTEPDMCDPPDSNLIEVPAANLLSCWISIHGTPGDPAAASTIAGFSMTGGSTWPGGGKTWADMHDDANPPAGAAGAGDTYQHRWDLLSGDAAIPCAAPIRTGYVVMRQSSQYHDAVCPNPGCFYNAPGSLAGSGSCTR